MPEKLHRIWEILSILDQREPLTAQSLSQHFAVSERTIYRDFEVIYSHFPVIFNRENKTYQFMEGYSLQKLRISKDELMTLLLSREIVSRLPVGVEAEVASQPKDEKTETWRYYSGI